MRFNKGIVCVALSAIIFGFTPILTRITYDGGSNGITMTFLRMCLCLPFLYVLIKAQGVSLRITKKQLINAIILGVVGVACTTILLYMSYSPNLLSVGFATTLHFIYPLVIVLVYAGFYHEKMSGMKWIAVAVVTIGICTFIDLSSGAKMLGIALALISGLFYAFYIIFSDKSGLKELNCFVLAFYACAAAAVFTFLFGLCTNSLTFMTGALTPKAWIFSVLVAIFTSIGAIPLMQIGIREVGATTAGILSTLEPITSVICGVLVLSEQISWLKLIGCVLIFAGVVFAQFSDFKASKNTDISI